MSRRRYRALLSYALIFISASVYLKLILHRRLQWRPEAACPQTGYDRDQFDESPPNCTLAPLPGPFFFRAKSIRQDLKIARNRPGLFCGPPTPLLVPFVSNICLLRQTLLSYIAGGWPPSHIIVIDNTGMSYSNAQNTLDPSHHAYLNYSLLTEDYGVNIYRSIARLTFSQTQNLMIELALQMRWDSFYQSHQDIVVRSDGDPGLTDQQLFYERVLSQHNFWTTNDKEPDTLHWAIIFFHYDWLSRINVHAVSKIGLWDTLIPYYPADCDYYSRVRNGGYSILDSDSGKIYDVASCLSDPERQLFLPRGSSDYEHINHVLENMQNSKVTDKRGRNTWQGRNDENSMNSDDFGPRHQLLVVAGRKSYRLKWGTKRCDVSLAHESFLQWLKDLFLGGRPKMLDCSSKHPQLES